MSHESNIRGNRGLPDHWYSTGKHIIAQSIAPSRNLQPTRHLHETLRSPFIRFLIDYDNLELLVNQRTAKHVIYTLMLLAMRCNCEEQAVRWAHLFRPELLQVFQLRRLEPGDEHILVHLAPLEPSRFCNQCFRALRETHSVPSTLTQGTP